MSRSQLVTPPPSSPPPSAPTQRVGIPLAGEPQYLQLVNYEGQAYQLPSSLTHSEQNSHTLNLRAYLDLVLMPAHCKGSITARTDFDRVLLVSGAFFEAAREKKTPLTQRNFNRWADEAFADAVSEVSSVLLPEGYAPEMYVLDMAAEQMNHSMEFLGVRR